MGYKLCDPKLSGIIMSSAFGVRLWWRYYDTICNCPNEKYLIFLSILFSLSLSSTKSTETKGDRISNSNIRNCKIETNKQNNGSSTVTSIFQGNLLGHRVENLTFTASIPEFPRAHGSRSSSIFYSTSSRINTTE